MAEQELSNLPLHSTEVSEAGAFFMSVRTDQITFYAQHMLIHWM